MTLHSLLCARIRAQGPLSVAEYMTDCLLHPTHGYYSQCEPFGTAGDFTTAPEISQMFGELLGLALAQAWRDQDCPRPFTLAEAGPGRGTLMADALRATRGVAGFHDAMALRLIEASPRLRAQQAETLSAYRPSWVKSVDDLPDTALYFLANEFFDALPVRQFQRDGRHWRERQIGLQEDRLSFGLGPAQPQPALAHRLADTQDGDLVEHRATASPMMQAIGRRIARHGGAALIVDYGDWRSQGDTLQAVKRHRPADPLADPGQADLTAHVDFEALAMAAAPARHSALTPQGVFLERLGITARAQALAQNASASERSAIVAAHRRLTHPQEMGTLFKVLGLFPDGCPPPPGLTHDA